MLCSIEDNLHAVPERDRSRLEPVIGAMNAGQVTQIDHSMRQCIQRAFLLHCPDRRDTR
jgi:hypothetical protein